MDKITNNAWQVASDAMLDVADASSSLREVLLTTLVSIHEAIPCDVLTLDMYHPAQDKLDVGFVHYTDGTYDDRPAPLTKDSLPYRLLSERIPIFISDTAQNTLLAERTFHQRESIVSVLVLLVGERVLRQTLFQTLP